MSKRNQQIILGLIGKLGSGKTEVANLVTQKTGAKRKAYGDYLKEVVWFCFGLEPKTKDTKFFKEAPYVYKPEEVTEMCDKLSRLLVANNLPALTMEEELAIKNFMAEDGISIAEVHRKLLQFVGTEIFRERDEHFWVKAMIARCLGDLAAGNNLVIDDVRFHDECRLVYDLGGKVVKIESKEQQALATGIEGHKSETEQDSLSYDLKLVNRMDGLDKLSDDVDAVLAALFDFKDSEVRDDE